MTMPCGHACERCAREDLESKCRALLAVLERGNTVQRWVGETYVSHQVNLEFDPGDGWPYVLLRLTLDADDWEASRSVAKSLRLLAGDANQCLHVVTHWRPSKASEGINV